MFIDDYHFGSITIDGKTYQHDVEVHKDGQILAWQRKESHLVDEEDIQRALAEKPEMIIIGTGEAGVAQVSPEVQELVAEKGIKLVIEKTNEAIRAFNTVKQTKVIGLFHLTC